MRIMNYKLPCKTKVFLVIFLPGILLSFIFSGMFFYERSQNFTNQGYQQLKIVSDQFAALYHASGSNNDILSLEAQLHTLIRNPNIISARIYDQENNRLADIGSKVFKCFQLSNAQQLLRCTQ